MTEKTDTERGHQVCGDSIDRPARGTGCIILHPIVRRFAGHAESLSLLRCHEASASAGFIASSVKIQVLPISMVLLPVLIGSFLF